MRIYMVVYKSWLVAGILLTIGSALHFAATMSAVWNVSWVTEAITVFVFLNLAVLAGYVVLGQMSTLLRFLLALILACYLAYLGINWYLFEYGDISD